MQLFRIAAAALLAAAFSGATAADVPTRQVGPTAWLVAESDPRGMDFDVYIRLRKGMTEGELLERAGPPDHQAADGTVIRAETIRRQAGGDAVVSNTTVDEAVKTYYYFPTRANPFTTTIKVAGGRIVDLKRERKF